MRNDPPTPWFILSQHHLQFFCKNTPCFSNFSIAPALYNMLFAFFHCVNCRVACLVSIKFIVFVCLVAGVCRPCTHLYNESTMKQFLTKPNENAYFPALYQILSSENVFLNKCRATATIVESNFSLRRKPCCHG